VTVEVSLALLRGQITEMEPPKVIVNLTHEEDKGGVGRLIFLATETLAPKSIVPLLEGWGFDEMDERALGALLTGWMHEWEWASENSYTPTGPYGLDFDV